ncbi:hypothetical protein A2757_03000 [Candidatus Giovannonibacteria bacterium RIFCSPHIGHO2_01_FULL_48_47]|nr:MAG: hypothetical protein A2757_03000 [Candidatus Giovannonibacteria bacterium RIFCSPHIGHO2_01_FULL_48_47]OGF68638.1 MAG: hypothetical protein A3D61_00060 [Candidatus Giovannonibacteria bacterium RIFCSPHIGHO2_02_FULL_48_15]OGF88162.1 MAG: hypothetical protein A3B26_00580 [Candidatus Giovannonibacteria bacterium RIFCSPLOWO2_01_FULL_48_47]OGF94618.1 MAG: hypothetical protein A2433_03390 [Candidatus Giovannonibacteria bacterium RIFOXYC1_FULL_48_8]OGF95903.1 MAG: hypothetical protein A2613_03750
MLRPILPPPYIFLGPLLIGVGLNIIFPLRIFPGNLSNLRFLVAAILALGGVSLLLWAIKTLFRSGVDPRFKPVGGIVSQGPFGITRNPMYVSFTLIYLGVAAGFNALWPILFLPIIFPVLHYGVILREEAYLEKTLSEEYKKYRTKVRRWL